MAKRQKPAGNQLDSPTFIVKLEKGLADRMRLPIDHVLRVLEEVRQMIADAGREIQTDMGMDKPTADFGLELLAGPQGMLFRPGSVQAQMAITNNIQIGILAAKRVVDTIESLAKRKYIVTSEADRSIVRRLNRINRVRQIDKTEVHLLLARPGSKKPIEAVFNEAAAASAWSLQAPVFEVEGMTVYGKLYELKDTDPSDEEKRGFWGELRRDNCETWRIKFHREDIDRVAVLFRKQVMITGTAKYYRIQAPLLIATDIQQDKERDYETAFDELYGCDRDVYGTDFNKAMKVMRDDA